MKKKQLPSGCKPGPYDDTFPVRLARIQADIARNERLLRKLERQRAPKGKRREAAKDPKD